MVAIKVFSFLMICAISINFVEPTVQRNGRPTFSQFIIGGDEASRGEWPWLVHLRARVVHRPILGFIPHVSYMHCGGSVINDYWILTAAHCFLGNRTPRNGPSNWIVRLAGVDIMPDPIDRIQLLLNTFFGQRRAKQWLSHVEEIVPHPGYNAAGDYENDIALVKLRTPVPSGEGYQYIQSINLPEADNDTFPAVNTSCAVSGWGCTAAGEFISDSARSVEIPIYSTLHCKTLYRPIGNMTGRLCAGYWGIRDMGICPGDSGGPLACKNENDEWIQVGVVVGGRRDNPGRYPGIYSRVSTYVDWINTEIRARSVTT